MRKYLALLSLFIFFSCKQEKSVPSSTEKGVEKTISHAKGFSMEELDSGITIIKITSPWPNAETAFTYALVPKEIAPHTTLNESDYDAFVLTPVQKIVLTSTTHIPALEALGVMDKLVGFPNTDLVSSKSARKRIDDNLVQDLGNNEFINTELVIELNPDVIIGFGMNNENKAYETIRRSHIPVVYNGEWTEETPLGKAEWIKFFAPFFKQEAKADSIFKNIEASYNKTKLLAGSAQNRPTVLTGGLYKDVWHVAGGKSWMAQFLKDAKADYLWGDNDEVGGIPLSLESVLDKSQQADFWLNPSMLSSYDEMKRSSRHYEQFDAFKNQKVYSNTMAKGATGGLMFYELAPQRPDLVLKDLIHIFHPALLPHHEPLFFKPLK